MKNHSRLGSASVPLMGAAEALHLRWTGNAANFVDGTGAIAARDPSAVMPGARGLLVNEPRMRAFLDQEGNEIIWTVLGCKEIIAKRSAIPAELHLNGVYRYNDGEAMGGITPSFRTTRLTNSGNLIPGTANAGNSWPLANSASD